MADAGRVALIDDDEAILDSLELYLRRKGFVVTCFESASAFLDALNTGSDFQCIVTDIRMPKMTGLELQRVLAQRSAALPIIMITGHGDIAMAVAAVKAGAFEFIEKPIDEARLATSVKEAVGQSRDLSADQRQLTELAKRFAGLSERQRQVVELAVEGMSNKEIGAQLGISPRTVEHYRESAMERLHARRFAELIQIVVRLRAHLASRPTHGTARRS
jgi:two-component system, LuxR family, response regulator FixJ